MNPRCQDNLAPKAFPSTKARQISAFYTLKAVLISCLLLVIPFFYFNWYRRASPCSFSEGSASSLNHLPSLLIPPESHVPGPTPPTEPSDLCPQPVPLVPIKHARILKDLEEVYEYPDYLLVACMALREAVQIPTETYDDMGPVGVDPRWDVFADLHEYLEDLYPSIYEVLEVTKVNTYGIVMRWQGSDPTLPPVLLTAHQDVVPVEPATVKDWIHPPYSGYFDGTWIWGRGSADDKSDLIAHMQTILGLLQMGFSPARTFIWAFGFDEESAGTEGAGKISEYLQSLYGQNGFAALLDEGGGYGTPHGSSVIFATPSLAEKGYLDARIEVSTPGGHSSVPPAHTSIGILASLITALEANPHEPALVRSGSFYNSTLCAATYGPSFPEHLRYLALAAAAAEPNSTDSEAALAALRDALLAADPAGAGAALRTTQAVDLVSGGTKVNALPERASAVVNHRIAQHASVTDVRAHMTRVVAPLAARFGLTLDAFGEVFGGVGEGSGGHVRLEDAWYTALEPAPPTPVGKADPYWVLAGTIRGTLESATGYNASGVVVAPQMVLGNTDTRFYWPLTKHIFRYQHLGSKDHFNGLHTINEAVRGDALVESIRFLTRMVLNFDEYL